MRIETRVFGALRRAFRSPELFARFECGLEQERKKIEGAGLGAGLIRLRAQLRAAEQCQQNILAAIAEGAPFAPFRAKSGALAAEIVHLNAKIEEMTGRIAA